MVSISFCVFVAVTLCFNCAWAGPMPHHPRDGTAGSRGVSQDVYESIKRRSQFAAAAYCSSNVDKKIHDYGGNRTGERIKCDAGTCPDLENDDQVFRVSSIQGGGKTGVKGFISRDTKKKSIVIAFMGSNHPLQWFTDIRVNQNANAVDVFNHMKGANSELNKFERTELCQDGMAHQGFLASWKEVREAVLDQSDWWMQNYRGYKIVLVGHSLGGAIATLAAAEIKKRAHDAKSEITVDLYTYGAPRVGNQQLIDLITNQGMGDIYIVKHYNDLIPRLPPTEFPKLSWNYADFPIEYYIDTNNDKDQNVRPRDIIRYDHPTEDQGNRQFNIVNPFRGHWMYFQNVPLCGVPWWARSCKKLLEDGLACAIRASGIEFSPPNLSGT